MRTETYLAIITVLAIFVMGGILAAAVLYPQGIGRGVQQNYITVSAKGFAYGYPSQSSLYLTVNGTGPTAGLATMNASLAVQELNATMQKYIGGNSSMIKTMSYSLSKVHNSSAYEVVEGMRITLPDINSTGSALASAASVENVYVNAVVPALSKAQSKALVGEALSDALYNATSQAEVLARNATVSVHNVTVNSYYVFPYALAGAAYATNGGSSQFYSGQNQVAESITVTFTYT